MSLKPWPDPPVVSKDATRLTFQGAMANCGAMINYERARADAWEARCRLLYAAVKGHNDACVKACGEGDQAGVSCGYRPYFPRRRPNCPLDDQIYDEEGRELLDVAIGELPK
jgi:hypothetical protein